MQKQQQMHQMDMPEESHVWGTMLEHYRRYTPKPTNTAKLKTVLLTIWNDLPQKSIDNAADGHSEVENCLNTEWEPDIHHWKAVQSLFRYS